MYYMRRRHLQFSDHLCML